MSASTGKTFRKKNPWYELYYGAKRRCSDSKHRSYKYVGGLGIEFRLTMCHVEYLFNWCGGQWMKQPSLDRIDATKDYCLSNCRVIEKAINERLPHDEKLREEWTD